MAQIYGGIQASDLQFLIRETMQDSLSQKDNSISDVSARLTERIDKVEERTRQCMCSFEERLDAILKQLQQKVDTMLLESHISRQETATQSKLDGMEHRFSSADERIAALSQRAGQLWNQIERKDEESREMLERLDDLNNRCQHKADSAYVDVRIAELRAQVQHKAESEDFQDLVQSVSELRQAGSDCRRKLTEKDEQMQTVLQQLAGKVEVADLGRLDSQVKRIEEQSSLKTKTLSDEQTSLQNRLNSFATQVITKPGSSAVEESKPKQMQAQFQASPMSPLSPRKTERNQSPRASPANSMSMNGMTPLSGSYAPSHVASAPGGSLTIMVQPPAGSPRVPLDSSSSFLLPRADGDPAARGSLHNPQVVRSQSVPGLQRGLMSPASPMPRVGSGLPTSVLSWQPQIGKQLFTEGKGLGRGMAGPFLGLKGSPQGVTDTFVGLKQPFGGDPLRR